MKSELKVYDSQFTLNRAKEGYSIAVLAADSFIESCNLTSDTASLGGGCISLKAANMTVKHSHFARCRNQYESSITITQSTLRLHLHSIDSHSAVHVPDNRRFPHAITCDESSRLYLDSVLISNYSSSSSSGCVYSDRCSLTMNNITFTDTDRAIYARASTVNIFNTVTLNDMNRFLYADSSHLTFWAFNMSGTRIELLNSVAEFRHTLFIRGNETCMVSAAGKSTIKLKSVYIVGPTNQPVCSGWRTLFEGNVSGRTLLCFLSTVKK